MGLRKSQPRLTVDEYLRRERTSTERHIYLDGYDRVVVPPPESEPPDAPA
jgi:hypothetical protein